MPWIREDLARNLRRAMRPGVSMERRYWTDNEAPHAYRGSFPRPDAVLTVTFASNGLATVTKRYYEENGTPRTIDVHWAPDDVIALVVGDHHDDRLILPGGYLQAHAGTMHQVWTAFKGYVGDPSVAHTFLAEGVSVAEGRKMLAELT